MTADSERYIQLQSVYREKANQDVAVVISHVHRLLQSLGRVYISYNAYIISDCLSQFCR